MWAEDHVDSRKVLKVERQLTVKRDLHAVLYFLVPAARRGAHVERSVDEFDALTMVFGHGQDFRERPRLRMPRYVRSFFGRDGHADCHQ